MFAKFLRLFLATLFLVSATSALAATPLDRVVAIVNDKIITQSQLTTITSEMQRVAQASNNPITSSEIKKKALDILIDQNLQLQLASHNKITITDAQVNEAIAKIAEQHHIKPAQLKEVLAKQNINYTKFFNQIHDQMLVHQLQQHIFAGRATVSDKEVQALLKNPPQLDSSNTGYRLDDIVIPLDESATPEQVKEAKAQASKILAQARKGVSFEQIAQNDSQLQHNDLGWRRSSEIPAVLATEAVKMKTGSLSAPIRAPNGLHLLKMLDMKGQAPTLTATEAKNIIFQNKIKNQIDVWLKQLRKSSYIEIMS